MHNENGQKIARACIFSFWRLSINSVVQLFVFEMCTRHTFTKLHSKSLQIYLGKKNIKEFAFYISPISVTV